MKNFLAAVLAVALLTLAGTPGARAALSGKAGPYQVSVSADPAVLAVGQTQLRIEVRDADGKPVEGAKVSVLTKMPTMDMGEQTETAHPDGTAPGVYRAPAVLAMAGDYAIYLTVDGPAGQGKVTLSAATGANIGAEAKAEAKRDYGRYALWIFLALAFGFTLYRMRRTGQALRLRALLNPGTLAGLALLAGLYLGARYAIQHFRRANALTPVEAQAMDMTNLPPPVGEAPVVLASVDRGPIRATVEYTGTAVGFTEEAVVPRVSGWIIWMPLYPGDHVRAGEVIARLDTRELSARVDERAAQRDMARHSTEMARQKIAESQANLARCQADVASSQGALEAAKSKRTESAAAVKVARAALEQSRSALEAARAEQQAAAESRNDARASQESARAGEADARARLASSQADDDYWRREIARMKVLLAAGAVSGEEFQREEAQAKTAAATVQQSRAQLRRAQSDLTAAEAREKRAGSLVTAARARVAQQEARIRALTAEVSRAQAAGQVAVAQVATAEGVLQARKEAAAAALAQLEASRAGRLSAQSAERSAAAAQRSAAIVRGYTEIRSRTTGVVTERLISPGTLVQPGQVILKLAQVRPIRLQANVSEADLARVKVGARVSIQLAAGGRLIAGRISAVFPAVDPVARTGVVEVQLANEDGRILPGQYLRMGIPVGERPEALIIPTRAIRRRAVGGEGVLAGAERAHVWIAVEEGDHYIAEEREVRLGLSDGERTEVLSGLEEGQQVIVQGERYLRDGDRLLSVEAGASTGEIFHD